VGKITDLNVVGVEEGKFAATLGEAHEYIVVGILTRLGFEVSTTALSGGAYDLVVKALETPGGNPVFLRCQIKTASPGGSIGFMGGVRAGVDREYISGVKEYKYTTEHNDLIIGIDRESLDLYLIPTSLTEDWGRSKSIRRLGKLKNRWDIFLNWNDGYLEKLKN